VSDSTLGDFLLPTGFARPALLAVLREGLVVGEAGRYAAGAVGAARARRTTKRTPYASSGTFRGDPVILVPGFMAGDGTLALMSRRLRQRGFRTYRSHIRANVGCTLRAAEELESRIEAIAQRRGTRVQVVGHSLGGMLARGLAGRRPDLISGIVTLGSPVLAPGAHHRSLTATVEVLNRLSRAGWPGLMSGDCVAGECARQSFEESRLPLGSELDFTVIYSRWDGIVDWRACLDPSATRTIQVRTSHVGMAVDPRVIDHVTAALTRPAVSVIEVDRGETA
jgi:pimeloyl-ACP methyl ester carboxylesterase